MSGRVHCIQTKQDRDQQDFHATHCDSGWDRVGYRQFFSSEALTDENVLSLLMKRTWNGKGVDQKRRKGNFSRQNDYHAYPWTSFTALFLSHQTLTLEKEKPGNRIQWLRDILSFVSSFRRKSMWLLFLFLRCSFMVDTFPCLELTEWSSTIFPRLFSCYLFPSFSNFTDDDD